MGLTRTDHLEPVKFLPVNVNAFLTGIEPPEALTLEYTDIINIYKNGIALTNDPQTNFGGENQKAYLEDKLELKPQETFYDNMPNNPFDRFEKALDYVSKLNDKLIEEENMETDNNKDIADSINNIELELKTEVLSYLTPTINNIPSETEERPNIIHKDSVTLGLTTLIETQLNLDPVIEDEFNKILEGLEKERNAENTDAYSRQKYLRNLDAGIASIVNSMQISGDLDIDQLELLRGTINQHAGIFEPNLFGKIPGGSLGLFEQDITKQHIIYVTDPQGYLIGLNIRTITPPSSTMTKEELENREEILITSLIDNQTTQANYLQSLGITESQLPNYGINVDALTSQTTNPTTDTITPTTEETILPAVTPITPILDSIIDQIQYEDTTTETTEVTKREPKTGN